MKKPKARFPTVFCWMWCTTVCMTAYGQTPNHVTASWTLVSPQFAMREPVVLGFVLKNESRSPLRLNLGSDRKGSFLFKVSGPDGKTLSPRRLHNGGFRRTGSVVVAASSEYHQRLVLNEWFDFDTEGNYEIEVSLAEPIRTATGAPVMEIVPFRTSFEVLPKHEERLRQLCELLVRQVYANPAYEKTAEAALQLSYIKDPIAIPFLASVLQAGRQVDHFAIQGLERIATWEAVQVLIDALELGPAAKQTDKQAMARAALARIALETADARISEAVRKALERADEKVRHLQTNAAHQ